ncbi:alpha-(1,3)-fucosyltransferase 7-like isoform X2 [Coccinella septempunctata]|uniref:alpha-(1,3)-fucosyltransferase 7-like isoform X2 n=1 Tax=Coccinella septempunctata TaxID=41139 RepID=UPI001D06950C|nr:alpha-(1,3)-fucosyltransferase 7-like isoform X2 [Coccinella septempunctata]
MVFKLLILRGRTFTLLLSSKKFCFILLSLLFLCFLFLEKEQEAFENIVVKETLKFKKYDGSWRNLSDKEKSRLSVLGRILYLEEERPPQKDRQFQVLFWKYGKYVTNRHLNFYTKEKHNPLQDCSVNNCKFSFDDRDLHKADLVVFHLHRTKGLEDLPSEHKKDQIWTFLTDESPHHTFLGSKLKIQLFNGKFNWSMSYRMDSDIPVPYGRTRKLATTVGFETEELFEKRRDKLVTILGSNCGGKNHRWQYVKKLNMTIPVDVYGGCGNKTACPGHFKSDCPAINKYLFYLSFENSDCREYITEKVFWNGYHKNSIPVVMGYNKKTYEKLLPPNSFLHVDDYASPSDLARMILSLNETGKFMDYFQWKKNYEVVNEHGYFKSKSYHLCRICEALNFNNRTLKVYDKLEDFWSENRDCSDV